MLPSISACSCRAQRRTGIQGCSLWTAGEVHVTCSTPPAEGAGGWPPARGPVATTMTKAASKIRTRRCVTTAAFFLRRGIPNRVPRAAADGARQVSLSFRVMATARKCHFQGRLWGDDRSGILKPDQGEKFFAKSAVLSIRLVGPVRQGRVPRQNAPVSILAISLLFSPKREPSSLDRRYKHLYTDSCREKDSLQ